MEIRKVRKAYEISYTSSPVNMVNLHYDRDYEIKLIPSEAVFA